MIQKEPFWEEITFEDVDFLVREIAPLIIFYEEEFCTYNNIYCFYLFRIFTSDSLWDINRFFGNKYTA